MTTCADHDQMEHMHYVAWHDEAERRVRTHTQRRCGECGLWKIWTRKAVGS